MIPQIAARLPTGLPEGVIWEVLYSGTDIDTVLDTYEYGLEEEGLDAPSWLDDWDMGDTDKLREAIDHVTDRDPFGVSGATDEDVAMVVDDNPELMDIVELVEQGIIDMDGDTDDFDLFMEQVDAAMEDIDDEKVDSIIALMDSASENENPEAVLANIGSLLLSAEQDIESDALIDPVGPDPSALFLEQFPDPTDPTTLESTIGDGLGPQTTISEELGMPIGIGGLTPEQISAVKTAQAVPIDYGDYDTSTAYGASVMHAIDYLGMTLEEAEEWALGEVPPSLPGGTAQGVLPTAEEADDAYFADLLAKLQAGLGEDESGFDVNMPGGMPPPKGFFGLGPGEGISWFDDVSMYDDATLENLETWDLYFKTLPIEYAKEDYGPGITPSLAEFSAGHFKEAFAARENKLRQEGLN